MRFTFEASGEPVENQQEIKDVFIKTQENNGDYSVTLAKIGHQEIDPQSGIRFLILNDGNRYSFAKNGAIDVLKFQEVVLRLDASGEQVVPRMATYSTQKLLSNLNDVLYQREFERRLSSAISLLIIVLMIPALSHSNPRQGRFGNLLVAIFIYVIYFNLLNMAQSWMRKGVTPDWLGLWWVHVVMLILALVIAHRFSKRM